MAKKQKLKIIPLGGLNEIGKNMTVFEYGDDILLVDCGMAFPEDEICDICHLCTNCMVDSENHCINCSKHVDDTCDTCLCCDNCRDTIHSHCKSCGGCLMDASPCPVHDYEPGGDNNHCEDCMVQYTCINCETCYYGEHQIWKPQSDTRRQRSCVDEHLAETQEENICESQCNTDTYVPSDSATTFF